MRIRVLLGVVLILVLPAGAAQSAPGGDQAGPFYQLVSFSATGDAVMAPDAQFQGESHTRAQLDTTKRYRGAARAGQGGITFKFDAAIDERVTYRTYSCEESFRREDVTGALTLRRWGAARQKVRVIVWAPYVFPGFMGGPNELRCRKFLAQVGTPKTYPLSLFKRKKFALELAGEQRIDSEGGAASVRYTARFVFKRLR